MMKMNLMEYSILAFSSLFVILDPITLVPVFIVMTAKDTAAEKLRMARLACWVAAGVLIVFAATGKWIFKLLGITLPAFQIAGSFLLMGIAWDMLYARRSTTRETDEEVAAGVQKDDIAITPLGVPMLAGPGAISTALILLSQAKGTSQVLALFVCIIVTCILSYWILWLAVHGARFVSPLAMKLATRLMGLLLAAMAVQFVINALEQTSFFKK